MTAGHLSKDFFEFIKGIGESKSKQEEDSLITKEIHALKQKISAPDIPSKKMKEYIIRMIYIEMLGHDASWGHVKAVMSTSQSSKLIEKRVGYLGVSLCLSPNDELMLLLVHTLQKDLASDNILDVSAALTVVSNLLNQETLPAIFPLIMKLLDHHEAFIRKKTIIVLLKCFQIDSSIITNIEKVKRVLCDRSPSVMGASLQLIYTLAQANNNQYKDLIPSLVSILKQITEHRLPRDYDYHRIPAPWIQIQILQLFSILGKDDKASSEGMYEIIQDCMKRADIGINVGYAIIYECSRTICNIYPHPSMIEEAANAITRFIQSDNHNLKYLGINALTNIVQISPKYVVEHQLEIISCLEDPDETLQRKTLTLLYYMTNPNNIHIIVEKLLFHLKNTHDIFLRQELVSRISEVSEKYAQTITWYLEIMNDVFKYGGNILDDNIAHKMIQIISNNDNKPDIKIEAFDIYISLLSSSSSYHHINPHLYIVISYVIGAYGHLSTKMKIVDIIEMICQTLSDEKVPSSARSWLLTSLLKLLCHCNSIPSSVSNILSIYMKSKNIELSQKAHEIYEMTKNYHILSSIVSFDHENLQIDKELNFLNGFVQQARERGCNDYQPPGEIEEPELPLPIQPSLKFEPYQQPITSSNINIFEHLSNPVESSNRNNEDELIVSGVKKVWGPKGFCDPSSQSTRPAQPQPQPQPQSSSTISNIIDPPLPEFYNNESDKELNIQSINSNIMASHPPQPHSLTKKEKLAQLLVSGLVESKTPTSTKSLVKNKEPVNEHLNKTPLSSHSTSTSTTVVVDFLGMDFIQSPPNIKPISTSSVSSTFSMSDDIFNIFSNSSSSNNSNQLQLTELQISLNEFGSLWGKHTCEMKCKISKNCSCENFMQIVTTLHFFPIQTRGLENIASSLTNTNQRVLLHGKVQPKTSTIDVTVRTMDYNVTEQVINMIQQAFI